MNQHRMFTSVHYVRNLIVNGINAGRDSGNTLCSLRSPRSTTVDIRCARIFSLYISTLLERSERSEQGGFSPLQCCGFPVHYQKIGLVNGVNRGGRDE